MSAFRRIANLFRRRSINDEIAAELQSHIDLRVESNIASGMLPDAARRDALLRFGNPTSTRERVSAADTHLHIEGIIRDIRYAVRRLRHAPGFALTAILTLALGIGANVVVFGVLNALILRPLNVLNADRLFEVVHRQYQYDNQSYPDFVDFKARSTAFTDMAAYRLDFAGLNVDGSAIKTWDYEVSTNYFDMLGVQPQLGRFFHPSDDHGPNSAPYIVISDALWRTRFNADPSVLGRPVELNKHPFTIIGVAPRTFNGTEVFLWPSFWMPMINEEQVEGYNFLVKRSNHGIFVIGSLKPGVTVQQATDNLNALAHQMRREHPVEDDSLAARLVNPGLLGDILGGPARSFLAVIMILSLLVLAAAGVNLAGIFAARSADRARELAIRLSIGSTRGRILRQLLTEAVLISLAGGAAGTLFASALLAFLTRWQPIAEFPIHVTVVPDAGVYILAFALSFLSGLLPGLIPARQIWRTDPMQAIRSGSNQAGALFRRLTLRDLLLGIQITLCALLVTASLVAFRGLEHSLHAPMGFVPQGVVVATTEMHMAGYTDDSALPVQRRMIDEASRIPGVTAVGTIDTAPLSGGNSDAAVYREGTTDLRSSNAVFDAKYYSVSPGYFGAAQSRLLAGRDFTWDDDAHAPKVAIVNQNFARRIFGSEPAVGRHFVGGDKTLYQIVGVIEDGKYDSLTEDRQAAMFFPLGQSPDGSTFLIVRSRLPASEITGPLNRVLTSIDAGMPFTLQSWTDKLALVLFPARVATVVLGVMGLLAAMLAITGVFGMSAYTVSRRLRELGIRVALGAHRAQLMRAALSRPFLVLFTGSAAGLALGVLASRLLANLVYSATPRDPLVLAGALIAMVLVGIVATWVPARRAIAVNPAQLLRED